MLHTSCISLLQQYTTTVEPEDLFCNHDLRKGGVAKPKFMHLEEGQWERKKATEKDFVVKWEMREGTRYQLKSIYTIDKWPCLWIYGLSASSSRYLAYCTADREDEVNKIYIFLFSTACLTAGSGNFVRSRGITQYQITDVSQNKNDSIVAYRCCRVQ